MNEVDRFLFRTRFRFLWLRWTVADGAVIAAYASVGAPISAWPLCIVSVCVLIIQHINNILEGRA